MEGEDPRRVLLLADSAGPLLPDLAGRPAVPAVDLSAGAWAEAEPLRRMLLQSPEQLASAATEAAVEGFWGGTMQTDRAQFESQWGSCHTEGGQLLWEHSIENVERMENCP